MKKTEKENKLNSEKNNKVKANSDKIVNDLRNELGKYRNKINSLQVEKKSFEEKYSKMAENYQKFFTKFNQNNPNVNFLRQANIEFSSINRQNDIVKILGKVNGTEKLIQTIKGGFNESLRELLLEISAIKDFVLYLNNEIITHAEKLDIKGMIKLDNGFVNMPFMESVIKIKYAFRNNISKAFDFWNLDEKEIDKKSFVNSNNNKESLNIFNEKNEHLTENYKKNNDLSNNEQNKKFESISLIREKCDSIFESEKNKDSILSKNNNDLFDQSENLIDFDIDNFNLEDSDCEKINSKKKENYKNNKKLNLIGRNICKDLFDEDNENDSINNSSIKKSENFIEKNKKKERDNEEYNDYLADKELEMLKLKWMKNLSN